MLITSDGNAFHACGAAMPNVRSPGLSLGSWYVPAMLDDRCCRRGNVILLEGEQIIRLLVASDVVEKLAILYVTR